MFQLPELTYDYDSLDRTIDAKTMEIHHTKHHAGYVANLNKALQGVGEYNEDNLEWILRNLSEIEESKRTAVRNHGGGHYNHSLFWKVLGPNGGGQPKGEVAAAIDRDFGSFDDFRKEFSTAAATRFGSGWSWLSVAQDKLVVSSSPNQDNPLMDNSGIPLLGLDVWEHAYYLRYQNRRPDYIEAFWDIVNWDAVDQMFTTRQQS